MKYNKLAYKIYKALDEKTQKCLGVEYDIERIDNTENKKWNDISYVFLQLVMDEEV